MAFERRDLPDRAGLADALAAWVEGHLGAALATHGQAMLAVSGGTTPVLFFETLARCALPWDRITVTLVDERCVDEGTPRSNATLVRRHLLQGPAQAARFVPLWTGAPSPHAARDAAEAVLAPLLARGLACAVLGMGTDGHTASFFPGGDRLVEALDPDTPRLIETIQAPGAGEPRLTLTLPVLLAAPLALYIEGAQKAAVLAVALQDGPVTELPVRAILRQDQMPLTLFWCP